MDKKNFFFLFLLVLALALPISAASIPYKYYKLTITSFGWNGAEFQGGFSGFSDLNATGTNMFSSYGSMNAESGWIWDGNTFQNFVTFNAGPRPYTSNAQKWMIFELDQARVIASFKLGNYIAEGSRWWITGITIEGSNDNINYSSLYSGAVSTAQVENIFNVQTPSTIPEPTTLTLLTIAFLGVFLHKKRN